MSFDPNGLGNLRPETQALHAGQVRDPTTNARAVPIYATTSYVFDDAAHAARLFGLQEFGNIYTRIMNPTTGVFEERVAALEGGVGALGLASGPGGRDAGDPQHRPGRPEHRVLSSSLYGGTYNLFHYTLPKLGIEVRFVDGSDARELRRGDRREHPRACTSRPSATRASTSPTSAASRTSPTPRACRSSSTTPSPRSWPGRSSTARTSSSTRATKWIGGHGTVIGGVVVDGGKFDWAAAPRFHEDFVDAGPELPRRELHARRSGRSRSSSSSASRASATSARRSARSTPGSSSRASRRCRCASSATAQNALAVAQWLQDRPEVEWVNYPGLASHATHEIATRDLKGGFGGIVTFGIKGGVGGRPEAHRQRQAVQPARQRGRREEPDHPPGQHHAPAADRRRAGLHAA